MERATQGREAELLTARQVGDRLGLRADTIRRWARGGRIPSVRHSPKVVRFEWGEVVVALKARKGGAA